METCKTWGLYFDIQHSLSMPCSSFPISATWLVGTCEHHCGRYCLGSPGKGRAGAWLK